MRMVVVVSYVGDSMAIPCFLKFIVAEEIVDISERPLSHSSGFKHEPRGVFYKHIREFHSNDLFVWYLEGHYSIEVNVFSLNGIALFRKVQ